jgi:hypothetical protein
MNNAYLLPLFFLFIPAKTQSLVAIVNKHLNNIITVINIKEIYNGGIKNNEI